jgi:hypothetical protein
MNMKNAVIALAIAAGLCGAMLGAVSAVSRARQPAPALKPVDLEKLDFYSPTVNDLADVDPAGFEALPRPGTPEADAAIDDWFWNARCAVFQRRYGHSYTGLRPGTR